MYIYIYIYIRIFHRYEVGLFHNLRLVLLSDLESKRSFYVRTPMGHGDGLILFLEHIICKWESHQTTLTRHEATIV